MADFRITSPDSGLLTVVKPLGKPVSLKVGELIKAEILDVLASGAITLRIKGSVLTAKTDLQFLKDSSVLFKVLGTDKEGAVLKLQFAGYPEAEAPAGSTEQLDREGLNRIARDIAENLPNPGASAKDAIEIMEKLLKSLPKNSNALPGELRVRLQELLQTSLKSAGETLQSRLGSLMKLLPRELPDRASLTEALRLFQKELLIDIERLEHITLKNSLQNTGVTLEAKLKSIVTLMNTIEQAALLKREAPEMKPDLKAQLFQLKEYLSSERESKSTEAVNGLIRDIETYQALSKLTDSFYTFLPVLWDRMKNGDVSFRKNKRDASGQSFSCRIDLDLEELGVLNVMILMNGKAFSVYFRVENNTFLNQMNSSLSELEKRFVEAGLNLKSAMLLDKKTPMSELENMGGFEGRINLKI